MIKSNDSTWDEFLDRIRAGNVPPYGLVHWDGETGQVTTSFHFELSRNEPASVVNARAWHFLRQLSPSERGAVEIEITLRDGKAVRAVFRSRGGVIRLGTARLKELAGSIKN